MYGVELKCGVFGWRLSMRGLQTTIEAGRRFGIDRRTVNEDP